MHVHDANSYSSGISIHCLRKIGMKTVVNIYLADENSENNHSVCFIMLKWTMKITSHSTAITFHACMIVKGYLIIIHHIQSTLLTTELQPTTLIHTYMHAHIQCSFQSGCLAAVAECLPACCFHQTINFLHFIFSHSITKWVLKIIHDVIAQI